MVMYEPISLIHIGPGWTFSSHCRIVSMIDSIELQHRHRLVLIEKSHNRTLDVH